MKYGFIGCGNMGAALVRAVAKKTTDIMLCDHDTDKAQALADELGLTVGDNIAVARQCERIFLGVKPQMMGDMLGDIVDTLQQKKPLLITMAAGLKIEKIEKMSGGKLPVIRIMPNTPVSVGRGMVLYCANEIVGKDIIDDFVDDMQFAGVLDAIDESLIDAACSVSGCGPAFMYVFANALANAGTQCGLDYEKAVKYAAATMSGAAELLLSSQKTPQQLTDAVCSKGGSTIEGVKVLQNSDFETIVADCVKASYKRNKQLGE